MLVRSDIHRSIARMTVDLHKQMIDRANAANDYRLAEREFQAQYEFSGKLGTLPTETQLTIPFTIVFLGDAGNQRDSALDRPQAKVTFEMLKRPAGAIPYAHVESWQRDDDFNYIGVVLTLGVHSPAMLAEMVAGLPVGGSIAGLPTMPFTDYHGIVHASFQGFGAVIDAGDMLGASTTVTNTGGL